MARLGSRGVFRVLRMCTPSVMVIRIRSATRRAFGTMLLVEHGELLEIRAAMILLQAWSEASAWLFS